MRRNTAGQAPERFVEQYVPKPPKRARQVKEDAPPLPAEAAPAGPDSEWVQCDLCQKWRIVKCVEIESLPDNSPWCAPPRISAARARDALHKHVASPHDASLSVRSSCRPAHRAHV